MGWCQFIPERLWGPAEGQWVQDALLRAPLLAPGVVADPWWGGSSKESHHGPSPAQEHGVTCATRELTPSQGRCWHLQHRFQYPPCRSFTVPPRWLPPHRLPSLLPCLALGPAATR